VRRLLQLARSWRPMVAADAPRLMAPAEPAYSVVKRTMV